MDRRRFLALTGRSSQVLVSSSILGLAACGDTNPPRDVREQPLRGYQPNTSAASQANLRSNLDNVGPLVDLDDNGLWLPRGFRSRVVARTGLPPVPSAAFKWHAAPDGGAVFAAGTDDDDGWIYVSNCEMDRPGGGVGALRFDGSGNLVRAYPILEKTDRNCAGGATPWDTWLSCEEVDRGVVWECDPFGQRLPVARPALGLFRHEAVAVDPASYQLYLTEDQRDGRFYRFTPERKLVGHHADLSSGVLEAAVYREGKLSWLPVPDPSGLRKPVRHQVPESSSFNGGEGIAYDDGQMYFATKGDDRVWAYDIESSRLSVIYNVKTSVAKTLTGVDNVTVNGLGDVLVAEDEGNMEIVAITPSGNVRPLVRVEGHEDSEVTGPAFSPDLSRLYFSSQRGAKGSAWDGVTYEVTGPFVVS